jgi:hypothetical protein
MAAQDVKKATKARSVTMKGALFVIGIYISPYSFVFPEKSESPLGFQNSEETGSNPQRKGRRTRKSKKKHNPMIAIVRTP